MFDLIKKTLYTGVGLAVMTKEKIEEMGQDLASQAKLSEQEGKEFVNQLVERSDSARKEMEDRITGAVQQAVAKLNLAGKDEVAKLSARVDELTLRLQQHESATTHHSH